MVIFETLRHLRYVITVPFPFNKVYLVWANSKFGWVSKMVGVRGAVPG